MALTKKQLEEIISGLNAKLEAMERKLDALEGLPNTVKKLEELLESSYAENAVLKQDLDFKEKQLEFLQAKVNSLEYPSQRNVANQQGGEERVRGKEEGL